MIDVTAAVSTSSRPLLAVKDGSAKGEKENFIATLQKALKQPDADKQSGIGKSLEAVDNPINSEQLKQLLKDLLQQLQKLLEGIKISAGQNTSGTDESDPDQIQSIDPGQLTEQLEQMLFSISASSEPSGQNKSGNAEMLSSIQQQMKQILTLLQGKKNIVLPDNQQEITGKLKTMTESIERLLISVSKDDAAKSADHPHLSKQTDTIKHRNESETAKLFTVAKSLETGKTSLVDNALRLQTGETKSMNQQKQPSVPTSFESGPMSRVQQFVLHLEKGGQLQSQPQQQLVREFSQILSNARISVNGNGQQQLTIKLYPEHLGTLDVRLTQNKGQMTATILAQTPAAKELVDTHLHQLRGAFTNQNLQVDKLEVMLPFAGQQSQKPDDGFNEEFREQQENMQHQDEEDDDESAADSFLEWLETHLK